MAVRRFSEQLAARLTPEDCLIQSMPDASPIRWHLAHTTWFFETFLLEPRPGFNPFDPSFKVLFNSYYNSIGDQFPRPQRGLISRPGFDEILRYREAVDQQMLDLLAEEGSLTHAQRHALNVGLHHEQQHQELMLTDIKHAFSCNPALPAFEPLPIRKPERGSFAEQWIDFDEGVYQVGWDQQQAKQEPNDFYYDNEVPAHRVFLEPYSLAARPVTCGQFMQFIEDGGYQRPELWLSLGWSTVNEMGWNAPLYWLDQRQDNSGWSCFTLGGLQPVDPNAPVCHLSYFEADAFARWSGARLPTEFEWEVACRAHLLANQTGDQFADILLGSEHAIHPHAIESEFDGQPQGMLGGVWEWTSSSYAAYPGYRPPDGALGEYNGKFMCNQYVLRGGSVATSGNHIRTTYRNFFPPQARWQFSGLRLARS